MNHGKPSEINQPSQRKLGHHFCSWLASLEAPVTRIIPGVNWFVARSTPTVGGKENLVASLDS
jgi:hypothetical protein